MFNDSKTTHGNKTLPDDSLQIRQERENRSNKSVFRLKKKEIDYTHMDTQLTYKRKGKHEHFGICLQVSHGACEVACERTRGAREISVLIFETQFQVIRTHYEIPFPPSCTKNLHGCASRGLKWTVI